MKLKLDRKYVVRGITAFLVVAASIALYYFVFHGEKLKLNLNSFMAIILPITNGLVIAYIMNPLLNFIEKKWMYPLAKKMKKDTNKVRKPIRTISIILTSLFYIAIIYALIQMLISQLIPSVINIADNFDSYTNNFNKWLNKKYVDYPDLLDFVESNFNSSSLKVSEWFETKIIPQATELLKSVSVGVLSFVKVIWNFVLGFIISIYLLASKETFIAQSKKILYAIFKTKTVNAILAEGRFINKTFINFFIGKIIDSFIIGIICFIGTSIMGTPYAGLVSVIIGFTNIIPFFGPIIGAVPTALLVLIVDVYHPLNCVYYIIFILILQQVDGNIIGPLILGESTGLSSFWIIFAITLFGGIWGVPGMLVGVPLWACIYSAIRRFINKKLKDKDLPTDSEPYLNVGEIDSNNMFVPHLDDQGNVISGEIINPMPVKPRKAKKKNKAIETIIYKAEELKDVVDQKVQERLAEQEEAENENTGEDESENK